MDGKEIENGGFTSDTVGLLIVNELRLMRRDMKVGLQRLDTKIDMIMEKHGANQIVDVSALEELEILEEHLVSSTTNYINKGHVQGRAKRKSMIEEEKQTKEADTVAISSKASEETKGNSDIACTVHVDINELPDEDGVDEDYLYGFCDAEERDQMIREFGSGFVAESMFNQAEKMIIPTIRDEDGRYHCDRCTNSYTIKGNLRRHYRHHLNDKRFECIICQRRFFRNEYLSRHMKNHEERGELKGILIEGENAFACAVCKKSFPDPTNLKRHMRAHTAERPKPYACEQCDERFSRENFLRRHIRKMHSVK